MRLTLPVTARKPDLIVSNSALMTKIYRESFWYEGEVAEFGSPRNDILFAPAGDVKQKVCAALGVPVQRSLALYAPTFRADGNMNAYCVDYARLQHALQRRFGGNWAILIRAASSCDVAGAGSAV